MKLTKTEAINYIGIALIVVQMVLQAIGILQLSTKIQVILMVSLGGLGLVLNGLNILLSKDNPTSLKNPSVWVSLIALILYVTGGAVDMINGIPNIDEATKATILQYVGIAYAIAQMIARNLFKDSQIEANKVE